MSEQHLEPFFKQLIEEEISLIYLQHDVYPAHTTRSIIKALLDEQITSREQFFWIWTLEAKVYINRPDYL